jgi:hypothetical protein
MRLINSSTLRLEEFTDQTIPPYATLSHTWGDTEATFQDIESLGHYDTTGTRFTKISYCCEEARRDGLSHAWVDTCCIDKSSSAELSEAINSMFRWYQKSQICYVYLSDLSLTEKDKGFCTEFANCRWFTRGWTLQELLASQQVTFFNKSWVPVGSKTDLSQMISRITRIDPVFIQGNPSLFSASIARRMSWASQRQTTRAEDLAYCLLGIFEINMPLLYGEGSRAFLRLQEELMKGSRDQSLFAWKSAERGAECEGVFAKHPSQFRDSVDIVPYPTQGGPYSMTNNGLCIQVPTLSPSPSGEICVLGCQYRNDLAFSLGIIPKPTGTLCQFGRGASDSLETVSWQSIAKASSQTIYLCTKDEEIAQVPRSSKCWLQTLQPGYKVTEAAVGETAPLLSDLAQEEYHGTFRRGYVKRIVMFLWLMLRRRWFEFKRIYLLFIRVPLGIGAGVFAWNPFWIFALNSLAIIPLHDLLGYVVDELSSRFGDIPSQILDPIYRTAVELIVRA